MSVAAPDSSTVARMLARLPALIRNHNRAQLAVAEIARGFATMSPAAQVRYQAFARSVETERKQLDATLGAVKAAAAEALRAGKIDQRQFDAIAASAIQGIGALPVIPIVVAVAIVSVAGAFTIWQLMRAAVRTHEIKAEQWRRFTELPPEERGDAARFVEAQNKGGGVIPPVLAAGGVSLAVWIVGGLILFAMMRKA